MLPYKMDDSDAIQYNTHNPVTELNVTGAADTNIQAVSFYKEEGDIIEDA